MKIYLAPMEGPTGYVYRNAYNKYFGGIDTYFTPFVTGLKLGAKEKRDLEPDHNKGIRVVPQILTNRADEFISVANIVEKEYGYREININLGCPSGTVVSRKRGAGFLSDPEMLDSFFDEIFQNPNIEISIKTRLGVDDESEWDTLMSVFESYPFKEVIVHARLRKDFYKGAPRLDCFEKYYNLSKHKLCYNGDITDAESYGEIKQRFPKLDTVMIGRGILKNPFLIQNLTETRETHWDDSERKYLKRFLTEIKENYLDSMPGGERNTLYKMKELWQYLEENFPENKKEIKQIKKANHLPDYDAAVNAIL